MLAQKYYYKSYLINFFLVTIPFSYIAGNSILNLNILLLVLSSIFFFYKEITRIELNKIDKLILIFFLYVFFNGVINNFYNFNFPNAPSENLVLYKSFFFMRFLILYFILRLLIQKNIVNYKLLFYSWGLACLFVSIDVIIQNYYGKDLFGFEKTDNRRLGGPFGNEYIAGGFVLKFFIFTLFSILIFKNLDKKKVLLNFIILTILTISGLSIIFSGNRIPLLFFIISLFLVFIFEKKIRLLLITVLVIFISIFSFLYKTNQDTFYSYVRFAHKSLQIADYVKSKIFTDEIKLYNSHIKEIETGIMTWKLNKTLGGGIKSFYFNCQKIDKFIINNYIKSCNSHPHNYYLEILSLLGLVGFIIIVLLFSFIIKKALEVFMLSEDFKIKKRLLTPFFIIFIIEIFPFKTTGSFFTSSNASFLFILIAFIVGLAETKKINYHE